MNLINFDNAEVDLRVLLTNPDKNYELGPSNPAVGTKWECVGKITGAEYCINVTWENGTTNSYKESELSSPEDMGRCKTIW